YDQGGGDFKSVHKYILPVRKPKADGRPFVLSEFGGYSNIVENHVWNKAKSFGYRMYGDKLSLTEAYKKLMKKQIIPLIKKGLSATVYTQVSDVEFEVNGLMTYDREVVKIDEKVINDLNLEMRSEMKK
ncbi:MAG: glycoside hydrolase family 2, partial [Clostridiales bacterium]|nr:glycoside hydrolase family 2 [Clostridiales bacterium]